VSIRRRKETNSRLKKGKILEEEGERETERRIRRESSCAADFSLLNLPTGKSLGRSKPATNS
jgi:hypothetical protein